MLYGYAKYAGIVGYISNSGASFWGKKIPDLAKGIGKGIKDFKKAVKEDEEEEKKEIASKEEPKVEAPAKETKSENV